MLYLTHSSKARIAVRAGAGLCLTSVCVEEGESVLCVSYSFGLQTVLYGTPRTRTISGTAGAAGKMIAAMNRSADPCTDFYDFSCGRWRQSNPIPDDEAQVSVFSNLKLDVDLKMASVPQTNLL